MLNYNVKLREDSAIYTEISKDGDKKVSVQEMYTAMQQNSSKKYYRLYKWPLVLLAAFSLFLVIVFIEEGRTPDAVQFFSTIHIFCWVGLLIFYFLTKKAQTSYVEYDVDDNVGKRMNDVKEAFEFVNTAMGVFPSAGLISIKFLKTNINIYGWTDPTDNDEIFFMPDVCLVNVKQSGFSAIEYEKMHSGYTDSKDTAQYPPSDSEILGKTWLHTRKDGQPDRRYTDNPTVYSIKKGFTLISDDPRFKDSGDSNFSAGLIISSPSIAKDFNSKMKNIFSSGGISTSKQKKSDNSKEKPDSLAKTFDSKTKTDEKPKVSKKGKEDDSDSLSKAFGSTKK